MKSRILRSGLTLGLVLGLTAAVSADSSVDTELDGLETPEWMLVDDAAKTVTLDIVAGMTGANNNWNFNGLTTGEATIVVPEGYAITLNFTNKDPAMTHSVGVSTMEATWPPMFTTVTPVFPGALSKNPTDMASSTMPGESETLTFVADKAGDYALVCYTPAHAVTGMWIGFTVSADGRSGVE